MKVGFIGLGTMGASIALNAIKGQNSLVVHDINRDAANPHLDIGAEWASSPKEVAAQSDVVFTSLPGPPEVESVVHLVLETYGRLDSLCNIAGILHFHNTHDLTLELWNQILAVNLTGTFLMCQTALPHLLESGGNIVNMSSTAALAGHPWTAAYSASKGGILALTRTFAVEYGRKGVRANSVCPGSVKTSMHKQFSLPEGADETLLQRIMALDRFRGPEAAAAEP